MPSWLQALGEAVVAARGLLFVLVFLLVLALARFYVVTDLANLRRRMPDESSAPRRIRLRLVGHLCWFGAMLAMLVDGELRDVGIIAPRVSLVIVILSTACMCAGP